MLYELKISVLLDSEKLPDGVASIEDAESKIYYAIIDTGCTNAEPEYDSAEIKAKRAGEFVPLD
jgi:hypothetical protein